MNPDQAVREFKEQAGKATQHFQEELKKLRTGRAHPSMVEDVSAVAYGTPMPLIQLATITTPEPQLIQISPFDPNNLQAIASAIRDNQSLGLNPVDDGRVVRIQVPPLTTERRQQIAKQLNEKMEECFISMRQARHDSLKEVEQAKKDGTITEDDLTSARKQLDDAMSKQKSEVEQLAKAKEQEIMSL